MTTDGNSDRFRFSHIQDLERPVGEDCDKGSELNNNGESRRTPSRVVLATRKKTSKSRPPRSAYEDFARSKIMDELRGTSCGGHWRR